jgi:hypothetical protein
VPVFADLSAQVQSGIPQVAIGTVGQMLDSAFH